MRELFAIAISELATLWYMLQYVLGLPQCIGYAFGFLLASWRSNSISGTSASTYPLLKTT